MAGDHAAGLRGMQDYFGVGIARATDDSSEALPLLNVIPQADFKHQHAGAGRKDGFHAAHVHHVALPFGDVGHFVDHPIDAQPRPQAIGILLGQRIADVRLPAQFNRGCQAW